LAGPSPADVSRQYAGVVGSVRLIYQPKYWPKTDYI
jgi:hypothetical protein